ncbi:MAG: hypothetical protein KatS3mg131_3286 [Candidatus Tectimicrobiota bacterium]|nr:MAG: hypothetical protein KatS3mg131_3286 [Candidatus Tectomicrobia bacterium]
MRWLQRLLRRQPPRESATVFWLYVRCGRCGEAIAVRVDRRYELVSELRDPGEEGPAYTLHKDIVGNRCFQRITVALAFDHRLQVIERHIHGGTFLSEEEYRSQTRPPAAGQPSEA